MTRKSAVAVFVLLLAALPAFAADPLSGKWVINDSTSSWSNGAFPPHMSLTINVTVNGDTMIYNSVNDTDKAKPSGINFTVPMDGKPHSIPDTGRINQIQIKRIGLNQIEFLELKDGDVVVGAYWWIDKGGKEMIRRGIARGADGHSHEYEEFFDKR
jgi:hypothetical protein